MSERSRLVDAGFDVVVIGAGVIGLAIATALSRLGRTVLILERDIGIGRGITSRNSEVIHAGLYYPANSLKAKLCVSGREALYGYCASNGVAHRRLGKLVVATSHDDESVVSNLLDRGRENGVRGLELIDSREISRLEPDVKARLALHSRDTGIVDGQALCLALLAESERNGVVLALGADVRELTQRSFGWEVEVSRSSGDSEQIGAGVVIDAGGLDADHIASLAGLDIDALGWRQYPCKGDYFVLGPGSSSVNVSRLIYPVPGQAGLGIHATLDLAGRIRFGPDTEYVRKPIFDVDPNKALRFRSATANYLPGLADAEFVPDYAGIRPKLAGPGEGFRDFVIEETSSHGVPGFVACLGIESPGLTASLAIGEYVAKHVLN